MADDSIIFITLRGILVVAITVIATASGLLVLVIKFEYATVGSHPGNMC